MKSMRVGAACLGVVFALCTCEATGQKRAQRVGPEQRSEGGPCDTSAWKLVFHDEFNGTALNKDVWRTWFPYSDDGSDQCKGCRIMGTSNTIFRDDLVSVEGGRLRLQARAREGEWYGLRKQHEGGMVHSMDHAKFTYGRFEARIRIPGLKGLWPAFWGFGGETEVDVLECCGEESRVMKGALHQWGQPRRSSSGKHKATDLSLDFHTYAVEWDRDGIRWLLDGKEVLYRGRFVDKRGKPLPACDRAPGTFPTAPYYPREKDAMNIILDLAISDPGGFCKGPKSPTAWPAEAVMDIDFVRVYQRQPQQGQHDLCREARMLQSDGPAPLDQGQERRIRIVGPHGNVNWRCSAGLVIARTDHESVVVRAQPGASGPQWVRAECPDDPCLRGPLMLEAPVELAR
jgi:beta-glucanase (GH16 family)